jgi:flavorubredoxin
MNKKMPTKTELIADKQAFKRSVDKLRTLDINIVYPGHGKPFRITRFFESYDS